MEQKDVLINRANTIINETQYFANDGPRVGGLIKDVVEYADSISQGQVSLGTVANLTALNAIVNPSKGDRYIVSDQINPTNNLPYYYVWSGSAWVNTGETIIGADAASKTDLLKKTSRTETFNVSQYNNVFNYADATTARNAVPSTLRGLGQQITYKLASGEWVAEQYQGADILAWATASNWRRVIDWFGICSIISTGVVKLDTYAKTITFPSSTVLVWRGRYYRLSESHQLSVSIDSGGDDAKLYFNAYTGYFSVYAWDKSPSSDINNTFLVATIRLSNRSINIGCPCTVDGYSENITSDAFIHKRLNILPLVEDNNSKNIVIRDLGDKYQITIPSFQFLQSVSSFGHFKFSPKAGTYELPKNYYQCLYIKPLINNVYNEQCDVYVGNTDSISTLNASANIVVLFATSQSGSLVYNIYETASALRKSLNKIVGNNYNGADIVPFNLLNESSKTRQGIVLSRGNGTDFDGNLVESPCIFYEPSLGKLVMLYAAYNKTGDVLTASHGYATSIDGINWEKMGQFWHGSGIDGDPDMGGCSGPVMVIDQGKYYLFYIGLSEVGYEAGEKALCLAVGNSINDFINGTAIRQGIVLSPSGTGWHAISIWHPNFVKHNGKWYLFINASGADGKERTGYAVSDTLVEGQWVFNETPLLDYIKESDRGVIKSGDPCVLKYGNWYIMMYFYSYYDNGQLRAADEWAYTTSEEFPLGWKYGGQGVTPGTNYDNVLAHKPWLMAFNGRIYHYYTAQNTAQVKSIALIF